MVNSTTLDLKDKPFQNFYLYSKNYLYFISLKENEEHSNDDVT